MYTWVCRDVSLKPPIYFCLNERAMTWRLQLHNFPFIPQQNHQSFSLTFLMFLHPCLGCKLLISTVVSGCSGSFTYNQDQQYFTYMESYLITIGGYQESFSTPKRLSIFVLTNPFREHLQPNDVCFIHICYRVKVQCNIPQKIWDECMNEYVFTYLHQV